MPYQKSILLVENDPDDQNFFINAFNQIGNTSLFGIANNGQEALDKLNDAVVLPDFIFMDINMPVMDGIECLKEIRKNPLFNCIAVIIVSTAIGLTGLVRKYQGQGFVKKVDDLTILHKSIEEIINLHFIFKDRVANEIFLTVQEKTIPTQLPNIISTPMNDLK